MFHLINKSALVAISVAVEIGALDKTGWVHRFSLKPVAVGILYGRLPERCHCYEFKLLIMKENILS